MKKRSILFALICMLSVMSVQAQNKHEAKLFEAAADGNIKTIEKMVKEEGVNPNILDQFGNTPIFYAAIKNEAKAVQKLSEFGAELNLKNENDNTALILAVLSHSHDAVDVLLTEGADPDIFRADGFTALHIAALKGNLQGLLSLISYSSDINKQSKSGVTPLMYAAHRGNLNAVRALLTSGAVDTPNDDNETALDWARANGHTNVVKIIEYHNKTVM